MAHAFFVVTIHQRFEFLSILTLRWFGMLNHFPGRKFGRMAGWRDDRLLGLEVRAVPRTADVGQDTAGNLAGKVLMFLRSPLGAMAREIGLIR